jgi:hypothetical protein
MPHKQVPITQVPAARLLRMIVAPWVLPKTVTSDEWCAAVDEYFNRMEQKPCSGSD